MVDNKTVNRTNKHLKKRKKKKKKKKKSPVQEQ
jgi:hypothetical protein